MLLAQHKSIAAAVSALESQTDSANQAGADPDTVNRELSVLRAAVGWWRSQGWIGGDPSRGLTRLPAPPDRTAVARPRMH